jgi:hypothetical protein
VKAGRQISFLELLIMALLVSGGVELNPCPPVEQKKIDRILMHVR